MVTLFIERLQTRTQSGRKEAAQATGTMTVKHRGSFWKFFTVCSLILATAGCTTNVEDDGGESDEVTEHYFKISTDLKTQSTETQQNPLKFSGFNKYYT